MAIKPGVEYEYKMKFYNGEYTYFKRRYEKGARWYKITKKTYEKEADNVNIQFAPSSEFDGNYILMEKLK